MHVPPSPGGHNLSVTALKMEDINELIAMVMALYAEDPGGSLMSPAKVHTTAVHLQRHPDQGRVVMLLAEGEIVGYAILLHYWSNEYGGALLVVDELFIKPAQRGRGFGRAFLQWVETRPDLCGIMLETMPHSRAEAFYQKAGFLPDSNRHFFKDLSGRAQT